MLIKITFIWTEKNIKNISNRNIRDPEGIMYEQNWICKTNYILEVVTNIHLKLLFN